MSDLEGVPLKMPLCLSQEEAGPVSTPEITLPDYLTILQDTEYEFSLENWVLTSLDGGGTLRPPRPPVVHPGCSTGPQLWPLPSCPPYWLMFSSPQQSRLASRYSSDFWEPDPRPRSNSHDPADLHPRTASATSDWGDDGDGKQQGALPGTEPSPAGMPLRLGARKAQKAFEPSLLNPPACLSSLPHQRRKNLRQCSLLALEPRGALQENQEAATPTPAAPPPSTTTTTPLLSSSTLHRPLRACKASTIDGVCSTSTQRKAPQPTPKSPKSSSLPDASPLLGLDSWLELLSVLRPEERALLRAITDRGYPLPTAFIALQKTGQQPPDQIFSYLRACEHLCELGYDKARVEEALEMFQNSETKAREFLNLLQQFEEMGFQQSTIKEALLVHDNYHERALEELMTHVA